MVPHIIPSITRLSGVWTTPFFGGVRTQGARSFGLRIWGLSSTKYAFKVENLVGLEFKDYLDPKSM